MQSFAPDTPQPYFCPPTMPDYTRPNINSRRASATTNSSTNNNNNNTNSNNYSPSRSSRSMRDRRRSSGAVSTHSQQKPKKCIGDYVVGKTLGKGASGN